VREDLFNLPEGEQHRQAVLSTHKHDRLAATEPYPRVSVSTSVLDSASTRVTRVLHQPV